MVCRYKTLAWGLTALVVVVVAHHGWESVPTEPGETPGFLGLTGSEFKRAMATGRNVGIALFAILGTSGAARAWARGKRIVAAIVLAVSLFALVANMTNTAGSMIADADARGNAATVADTTREDAIRERDRLEAEIAAFPAFEPTTQAAVAAANRNARAARGSADSECGVITQTDGSQIPDPNPKKGAGRGPNCRSVLEPAAAALEAEALALADRLAKTEAKAKLDADLATARAAVKDAPPAENPDTSATALVVVAGMDAADAGRVSPVLNVGFAVLMEIGAIAMFMVADAEREHRPARPSFLERIAAARQERRQRREAAAQTAMDAAGMIAKATAPEPAPEPDLSALVMAWLDGATKRAKSGRITPAEMRDAWNRHAAPRGLPTFGDGPAFGRLLTPELGGLKLTRASGGDRAYIGRTWTVAPAAAAPLRMVAGGKSS